MASTVRVRFAPSPTGTPHVGNIRSALFGWLTARHTGGTFILRIEDTDRERFVETSLGEIKDSLNWLGLDWDEGPGKGGDYGPYIQSERLEMYREHQQKLIDSGHAYPCYCSSERLTEMREQLKAEGKDPKYDRRCLGLSDEEKARLEADGVKPVLRFRVPDDGAVAWDDVVRGRVSIDCATQDDFIIIKSDGYPTYNFANVVDDSLMKISHVIRGEEFVSSTPKHLLLYKALGAEPPAFVHVPLILGPDRAKLGKRHGATSVLEYRRQGYLPEAMFNFLALLGWAPGNDREILTRDELVEAFAPDGISKSPSIFDHQKLEWMNKQYFAAMPDDELAERVRPLLQDAGLLTGSDGEDALLVTVCGLLKERIALLPEFVDMSRYFFSEDFGYEEKGVKKHFTRTETFDLLRELASRLEKIEPFSSLEIENTVRKLAEDNQLGAGKVIHPTRLAVSGALKGPGLFELLEAVGRERVLARLRRAVDTFSNA